MGTFWNDVSLYRLLWRSEFPSNYIWNCNSAILFWHSTIHIDMIKLHICVNKFHANILCCFQKLYKMWYSSVNIKWRNGYSIDSIAYRWKSYVHHEGCCFNFEDILKAQLIVSWRKMKTKLSKRGHLWVVKFMWNAHIHRINIPVTQLTFI